MKKESKRKKKARWLSDKETLKTGFLKLKMKEDGTYCYLTPEDCKVANVLVENADRYINELNKEKKNFQKKKRSASRRQSRK